ncbi:cupin domain-containing protein [Hymenobacter sp. M29]|uniref:Cupin domain-containing protein n=1 Tax=Hymenobacter mellowenesis TaxID=3063995 RepID=A0ABT9A7C3_9BACT|nr:cupin domain-containing protein [Hymenobacter sp. M29]MDO7845418.1 cupin domain-containing protein [Hymenobacter sp. M29]
MQRRHFLATTLLAAPAAALAATGLPTGFPTANAEPAAPPTRSFTVTAGEGRFQEKTFVGPNPNDIKISGKDTGGALAVFEYTGMAKGGPSLHLHLAQDEVFYVVSGDYLFVVGEEQRQLKAGDTIFLPRQVPHTWTQLSDTGKLVYFLQPAGQMEDFFRARSGSKAPLSVAEREKLFTDHGMKLLGPPLPVKS